MAYVTISFLLVAPAGGRERGRAREQPRSGRANVHFIFLCCCCRCHSIPCPFARQREREGEREREGGISVGCMTYIVLRRFLCLLFLSFFFVGLLGAAGGHLICPVTFQSRAAIYANLHFALATFELPPLSPLPLPVVILSYLQPYYCFAAAST